MRTAWWICIAVVSTTGCMPSLHRIPADGRRRFYLTKESFQGNQAITACASGYHMASRFEILDVSVLQYDTGKGLTTDDSGAGPPSMAASYESPGPFGWIRTGGTSQFTNPTSVPGAASVNCATWSTNSPQAYGTVAFLTDRFTTDGNAVVPAWNGRAERCDVTARVWCVENSATRETGPPEPGRRRRWRGGAGGSAGGRIANGTISAA